MKNKRLFPQFFSISWISLGIFVGISIAFYFFIVSWGKEDEEKYRSLMENANPRHATPESSPYTAVQQRLYAHKDIWFTKKSKRFQLRVRAANSQLVFDHRDNSTEVIEKMRDVKSSLQEELYYVLPDQREVIRLENGNFQLRNAEPKSAILVLEERDLRRLKPMQVVRYMEAKEAEYRYRSDSFVAHQVKILRYVVPGHEMCETFANCKQMASGVADSIEVSLKDNEFKFKAYQMKATMNFL